MSIYSTFRLFLPLDQTQSFINTRNALEKIPYIAIFHEMPTLCIVVKPINSRKNTLQNRGEGQVMRLNLPEL